MKPVIRSLYLIRHGETEFNAAGQIQGRGIDSSLNERGREQADAFWRNYPPDLFDGVYCSSLKRTRQTIERYAEAGVPCVALTALDEFGWGEVEGKPYSAYADTYRTMIEAWTAGDYNQAPPQGESPAQVALRQQEAIARWRLQPAGNILVCMHGRALRLMLCQLLGLPLSQMEGFTHTNLSLYLVEWDGVTGRIRLHDDRRHLQGVGAL